MAGSTGVLQIPGFTTPAAIFRNAAKQLGAAQRSLVSWGRAGNPRPACAVCEAGWADWPARLDRCAAGRAGCPALCAAPDCQIEKEDVELIGQIQSYENVYKLCYVRGREGIILELAEQIE